MSGSSNENRQMTQWRTRAFTDIQQMARVLTTKQLQMPEIKAVEELVADLLDELEGKTR